MIQTYPVESWTLLRATFCWSLPFVAFFSGTVFDAGFFDSEVFVTLFTAGLPLSPDFSGLTGFGEEFFDSLGFAFSFPFLEDSFVVVVEVRETDFLLLFNCL